MRFIIFFLFLLYSTFGVAQTSYPTYQSFGSINTLTEFKGAGKAGHGFINGVFQDTATANLAPVYLKYYPGSQIQVGDSVYFRDITATKWLLMNGAGGSSYTSSQGITLSGSDFRLGGAISSPAHITTERALISDSNVILHYRSKYDGTTIPVGGENVSFAYASYAPYQFISYDTAYTNKTATTYDIYPQSNTFSSRRIHFPVGGGKSLYGLYGNKSEILYTAYDSAVIRNDGGDYGGAQINQFKIRNIPGYNGRTVFKMYHGAGNDIINTPSRNIDGAWATLSNTYIENDNAANPIRIRGRIFGHMSYLVMGFVAADTLDEWVPYGAGTFMGAPGKVTRIKFFAPTIGTSLSHQDSVYLIYDRDSPGNGYKSIHKGSMLLGSHIYTTSPYKLDVQGAVRFYDSLRVKTSQITDTTGYNIVFQRRLDSVLVSMPAPTLAAIIGSGGGSPQNLSYNSGTHAIDIDGGGTSAVIPLATSSANGLATPNQVIGNISTSVDGMGSVVTTGSKGFITIPYNATITNWYVACNASGSIQFDIKRSGTSIVGGGGNKPLVSSAQNGNAAVSGWTSTSITAGDIIEWNVDSATTVVYCSCTLKVIK